MNLNKFKYLIAVAEYKHFGRAAKSCFVSQPALSMQLQKLETELGVQLFERTNKNVMITAVGKDIVKRAKQLLQDVNEIKEIARAYHDPFAGELRLGAFPTLAPYFFPSIVPQIKQSLPELKLLLVEEKTDKLLQKIKNGEIDAAFLALGFEDDKGLETLPLFDDPFLLAVPTNHLLANRKKIKLADIAGEKLLLLEDGHCLRSQALSVCSLVGAKQQEFRATSMETLRQMVASGVGITLIPKLARKDNDGIAYVDFSKPYPSRTICLVWRKTSPRIQCFKQIAETLNNSV